MNFVQLLAVFEDQELIKNDKQREFLLLKYEVEKAADLPNDLMQMAELANGLADWQTSISIPKGSGADS